MNRALGEMKVYFLTALLFLVIGIMLSIATHYFDYQYCRSHGILVRKHVAVYIGEILGGGVGLAS
ncbi:hypothetical protein, partial [Elioraea sp.]|uniref:hypothetical protein n=1 Tax=Elioraea sp. TaxID=2185103 RepID=UPI003F6F9804